ncbi:RHS repeat-associated core domain-containing protein, partial [Myroides sp. LoEW2-1]
TGKLCKVTEPTDSITTWLYEVNSFVPCGKIKDGESFSIVSNYLGTPEYMYDATGDLVWHGTLDIYGRIDMKVGKRMDCPFRYQGQYDDLESGLYYNRFRYYSPDMGMYVSQDPIKFLAGIKFYPYVEDSNIDYDSLGLISEGKFGTFKGTKNTLDEVGNGIQRHHLNQTGVFNFDRDSGRVIGLEGYASRKGSQHYKAHLHMDDFYEKLRVKGKIPSVFRYNVELYKSLRKAEMGRRVSVKGVYFAVLEQLTNGKFPWNKVDNINVKRVAHH